jgi:hypothetical protein
MASSSSIAAELSDIHRQVKAISLRPSSSSKTPGDDSQRLIAAQRAQIDKLKQENRQLHFAFYGGPGVANDGEVEMIRNVGVSEFAVFGSHHLLWSVGATEWPVASRPPIASLAKGQGEGHSLEYRSPFCQRRNNHS